MHDVDLFGCPGYRGMHAGVGLMVDPASGLPMPLPNAANNCNLKYMYTRRDSLSGRLESYDHVLAGPSIGLLPRVVQQDYVCYHRTLTVPVGPRCAFLWVGDPLYMCMGSVTT